MANQKGGVAKTTTVASLGTALAHMGRRVLLVDLDPQACLTFSMGLDPEQLELSLYQVLLEQVAATMVVRQTDDGPWILPAVIDMAGVEASVSARPGREYVLREALEPLRSDFDHILLDCSPSLGVLTLNALTAADAVLIPLQCETLSYRGVGQLLDTITQVQRRTNRGLQTIGVLPTMVDTRSIHTREVLADVTARYGLPVIAPGIPRSVRFAEAPNIGRSVLRTARTSRGAQAYRDVAAWLDAELLPELIAELGDDRTVSSA